MAEAQAVTPDYERGLTFEKVWAAIHEGDRQMRERLEESDRKMRERSEETDRKMRERSEETDRKIKEQLAEAQRIVNEIGKKSGYMDHRFGELAEHLVAPNIAEKFNALGFHFDGISPGGKEITDGKGHLLAEVDLLLENGEYILAVEIKAKPRRKDLGEHLKRLEVLRRH
ncbi:MAG: hypothetical protein LBP32_01440, partial [Spirochaetaceae bacterium]|nr:hypothetical protein [Spirochaetaceae bacterium]